MSPAARELALIGHAKSREPVLSLARKMREAMQLPPHPALAPPLILSMGDRLIDRGP